MKRKPDTVPARIRKLGFECVLATIGRSGEQASRRFIEFFTANIRN